MMMNKPMKKAMGTKPMMPMKTPVGSDMASKGRMPVKKMQKWDATKAGFHKL